MKSKRAWYGGVCAGLLLAGMASRAQADLAYTFDADAQGFTVNVPAGELSHVADGYLRIVDLTDQTNVSLILPGAALAGGWAAYEGGTLSFDARLELPIGSYWPEFGTITLSSAAGSASADVAGPDEPTTAWKTYSIKLDAALWGAQPATFSAVLAGLQGAEISMEAGNGPIEVLHIDNIKLTSAVPEASTSVLSMLGLAVLGWRARRR
jgi:hypothetical protein